MAWRTVLVVADESQPSSSEPKRKPRKIPTLLVSIAGWPSLDPGRQMIYSQRPTVQKAERMAKRLRKRYPDMTWEVRLLTNTEMRKITFAPFVVAGPLAIPVEMQWTGRSWSMTLLSPKGRRALNPRRPRKRED